MCGGEKWRTQANEWVLALRAKVQVRVRGRNCPKACSRKHGVEQSNRDKSRHRGERGLDSATVQTEQYDDYARNQRKFDSGKE
jgi:hypothetical protein